MLTYRDGTACLYNYIPTEQFLGHRGHRGSHLSSTAFGFGIRCLGPWQYTMPARYLLPATRHELQSETFVITIVRIVLPILSTGRRHHRARP
jgi:hypothetical protein